MTRNWRGSLAFASLGFVSFWLLGGCSHNSSEPTTQAVAETEPAKRPIPPDSPFAKIKEGMGSDEVYATIGQPTSSGAYMTGKSFIPFHYGGDNTRMLARYKGIGTITFSQDHAFTSRMTVISIDYDPNEPGFEK